MRSVEGRLESVAEVNPVGEEMACGARRGCGGADEGKLLNSHSVFANVFVEKKKRRVLKMFFEDPPRED